MGVEYRQLPAEGCAGLTGAGVYYGATASVAADCDDDEVYVIGGANSAGQAAMYLSRTAKSVTIVSRRTLEDSMSYYLIQQIRANDNIKEHAEHRGTRRHRRRPPRAHLPGEHPVRGARGGQLRADVHLHRRRNREPTGSRGSSPATTTASFWPGPDLRDVCGWTLDRPPHHLETSVPGVFVAGDVRAESAKRVAAAVGEGSMAVMLVHRYLAEA